MKHFKRLLFGLLGTVISLSSCEKEESETTTQSNCGDTSESIIVVDVDSSNFEFSANIEEATDELIYEFNNYKTLLEVEISVGPSATTNGNVIGISSVKGSMDFTIREKTSQKDIYSKTINGIVAIDESITVDSSLTYQAVINLACFDGRVAIEVEGPSMR